LTVMAQELARLQQVDSLLASAQTQPQTQMAGQGTGQQGSMSTGIPEVAVPGSAQDIQNKLANQRSQTSTTATQGQGGGGNWRS